MVERPGQPNSLFFYTVPTNCGRQAGLASLTFMTISQFQNYFLMSRYIQIEFQDNSLEQSDIMIAKLIEA